MVIKTEFTIPYKDRAVQARTVGGVTYYRLDDVYRASEISEAVINEVGYSYRAGECDVYYSFEGTPPILASTRALYEELHQVLKQFEAHVRTSFSELFAPRESLIL